MHPRRLLLLLCLALATSLQGQDTVLLKQLGVNVCRENPLHDFLSSPIQSVIINSGYFVYRQDTLRLTANSDSTLRAGRALLTHFYRKHHYDEEPGTATEVVETVPGNDESQESSEAEGETAPLDVPEQE